MIRRMMVLLMLSAPVMACPKGYVEWAGLCAADPRPAESAVPVAPSDEKPSRHPEPAWQRGEVHAIDLQNLIAQDTKADQEQAEAIAQGKTAAKLPR